MFQPASAVPCARIVSCLRSVHARKCSHVSSPRAWAQSRRSGGALRLVHTPLRHPSAGQRGEVSTTPIERVANRGFLVELLSGDSSGRLCPFDKGRLAVRRHVHESAYAGVLGRARSRSLGTEGAEALPRWDPSTSGPRWLLNTTRGAPSSWWARGLARMCTPWSSLTLSIWGAC
jgi:hypothetical protein